MQPIRRKDREISLDEARAILTDAEYGILSTVDNEDQPYSTPLSFVYHDGAIYFHCAKSGQKLDNIAVNTKVSFCVVGKTRVLPEKFGTEYESVVIFGNAAEVSGEERQQALLWLLEKYCAGHLEAGMAYIDQMAAFTMVIKISIRHISGKARRS